MDMKKINESLNELESISIKHSDQFQKVARIIAEELILQNRGNSVKELQLDCNNYFNGFHYTESKKYQNLRRSVQRIILEFVSDLEIPVQRD